MAHKDIAVLYHGGCGDGFGAAYAAWKKFGDAADYIPVQYGKPVPNHLEGNDVYFVDFCYPGEIMQPIIATAKSVTVLDHHLGNKANVESMPNFVFDETRSAATIAWSYFHPDTPVPLLLQYVQEGDLYLFRLPDSHGVLSYLYAKPFHFDTWDELAQKFEDATEREKILSVGRIYSEHFDILVEQIAKRATLVSFEGYEVYLASAASMFTSDVGNHLVKTCPPLALIANLHGDVLSVSLRSNSSVDVSAIARKYGGNGHPQASAFRLKWGDPLPWTVIESHETPRD
jgi:uncharacterized protein